MTVEELNEMRTWAAAPRAAAEPEARRAPSFSRAARCVSCSCVTIHVSPANSSRCASLPPVHPAQGRILTGKPVVAEDSEADENPRSRSAKLRVFEKRGGPEGPAGRDEDDEGEEGAGAGGERSRKGGGGASAGGMGRKEARRMEARRAAAAAAAAAQGAMPATAGGGKKSGGSS